MSGPKEFQTSLQDAIRDNDYEEFSRIAEENNEIFDGFVVECGDLLVLNAVKHNSHKVFNFLVPLQTPKQLHAIMRSLDFSSTFDLQFFYTLIENKAPFGALRCTNFPGDHATNVDMLKFALDRGLDPNSRNKTGLSVLHYVLHIVLPKGKYELVEEVVLMLLCYGADPLSECRRCGYCGYSAFELACRTQISDLLFEQLVLFCYDGQFCRALDVGTFVDVVRSRRRLMRFRDQNRISLVSELLDCKFELVIGRHENRICILYNFVNMRLDYLDDVLNRCPKAVQEVLEASQFPYECTKDFGEVFMDRIQHVMAKNEFYHKCVMDFLENVDVFKLTAAVTKRIGLYDFDMTGLILFLLQYGGRCNTAMYHFIYKKYGDCALFRTLLYLDPDECILKKRKCVMATFITDLNFNVQTFVDSTAERQWTLLETRYRYFNHLQTPFGDLLDREALELLQFFAHPSLVSFFLSTESLPENVLQTILLLPRVPLLQELARDAVRPHIVKRFNVKTTKQFYFLVDALPTTKICKKIISFEAKLYNKDEVIRRFDMSNLRNYLF
ncbi:uncharacterized protein LOC135124907 [Zophobas morio]|uniref:uncharacterized protein LOC135124907 n=1 Tax=Zophobas morio TaxID=2755281 RepID=UPI0030828CE8